MFLADKSIDFSATSPGTGIIARPFFNLSVPNPNPQNLEPQQSALPIAYPGLLTGGVTVSLASEFSTLEALWRQALVLPSGRQVSFLAGYRYAYFAERLDIESTSTDPTTTITNAVSDRFSTLNSFQGAEIGFSTKKHYKCWSVELLGKFALGNTRSNIIIAGQDTITRVTPADRIVSGNGLLANNFNNGTYVENNFTVIPELGITIGYEVTARLKASFGYTFLYWSHVARPSDQIDMNVNPNPNNTTLQAPQFRFVPSDYWVQGLNLGLEYKF
jgi:hypothetical protein